MDTNLTEEQMAKARECKTPEDLMSLVQQEGIELTDDQLEAVAGGSWDGGCPDDSFTNGNS